MSTCETVCRDLGTWGELIAALVLAARIGWSEHKTRAAKQQAEADRLRAMSAETTLRAERASMAQSVQLLSLPPAARVPDVRRAPMHDAPPVVEGDNAPPDWLQLDDDEKRGGRA